MAQKVIVSLVDDLDGGAAEETVEFALDGKSYQIDLSDENAKKLREAFAAYVDGARRATTSRGTSPRRPQQGGTQRAVADREQNQAIRDWANRHGMKVSDRGRIPGDVVKAYHNETTAATS